MSHQSLKSLVSYLVDISVISQGKQSTVYNFVQKRLAKYGVTSVSYEISDTQSIVVSRDAATYLYSVEIITAAVVPAVDAVVPPFVELPLFPSEPKIQLALNLLYEIDILKAAIYFKQHKKPRKLKIIDNTPSPQLTFNFDVPTAKNNVVPFVAVRQGKSAQMRNVA